MPDTRQTRAPLRDRRDRRPARDVLARAVGDLRGNRGARRALRLQPGAAGGRRRAGRRADRQRHRHLRRRRVRADDRRAAARDGGGDGARRAAPRLHRPGDGGRLRRRHREADDDRPRQARGDPRRAGADRAAGDGDLQLPLHAGAHPGEGHPAVGGDRADHRGRLPLAPRPGARRRLLPALAPLQGELGRAAGAQVDAPLRPAELVARRHAGQRRGARGSGPSTRRRWRPSSGSPGTGRAARTARPALRLPARHRGRPGAPRALPRRRARGRLPARPLRLRRRHRHRGHDAGAGRLRRRARARPTRSAPMRRGRGSRSPSSAPGAS